jgi:hypothetical protein
MKFFMRERSIDVPFPASSPAPQTHRTFLLLSFYPAPDGGARVHRHPRKPVQAAKANDPAGIWLTQSGDAKVRVNRCGATLCGRVVWLKEPIDKATGKPQRDDRNADPSLRGRRVIGISLFIDMQPAGPNKWSGKIYNADDGRPMRAR